MASIVRAASVWLLALLFAVSLAAFFTSLSAAQLTTSGTGERVLRRAIAVSTGIDASLPTIEQKLHEAATGTQDATVQVPDYPIAVQLTREEAQTLTGAALRDRILAASADVLYDKGMSAFGASDPQASRDLQRASAAGALNDGLGQVHDSVHAALLVLTVLLGVITLCLGVAWFLAVPWDGRLPVLGGAGLVASLPLLAAAVALRFAFRTAGPDADPFVNGLFDIGADGMWVPIRNFFSLALISLCVMLIGTALLWWEARNVQIEYQDAA
jgi:hypothetical protein